MPDVELLDPFDDEAGIDQGLSTAVVIGLGGQAAVEPIAVDLDDQGPFRVEEVHPADPPVGPDIDLTPERCDPD